MLRHHVLTVDKPHTSSKEGFLRFSQTHQQMLLNPAHWTFKEKMLRSVRQEWNAQCHHSMQYVGQMNLFVQVDRFLNLV